MVLHHLIAVGADCGRHDQPEVVGVDPVQQFGHQAQELLGLRPGIGGQQLLGLIQRQHQGRGAAPSLAGISQPLGGGRAHLG